jgi:hypothetical protein
MEVVARQPIHSWPCLLQQHYSDKSVRGKIGQDVDLGAHTLKIYT